MLSLFPTTASFNSRDRVGFGTGATTGFKRLATISLPKTKPRGQFHERADGQRANLQRFWAPTGVAVLVGVLKTCPSTCPSLAATTPHRSAPRGSLICRSLRLPHARGGGGAQLVEEWVPTNQRPPDAANQGGEGCSFVN